MVATALKNIRNQILGKKSENSTIARLIELGRHQGYLSYKDILHLAPKAVEDTNLLDEIFAAMFSANIPYVADEKTPPKVDHVGSATKIKHEGGKTKASEPQDNQNLQEIETRDLIGLYLKEVAHVPLLTREQESELCARIERGRSAREEFSQGKANPQKQKELQQLIIDGWAAREHLIRANSRLVISIAKKYIGRGVQFLDLIQEGNIGLMRAAKKYDYRRGFKFSTYASWWIRQAVSRSVADQSRTIRVPVHMMDQLTRLFYTQRELEQKLQRSPTIEELARELDISPSKVKGMLQIARFPLSLEEPIDDEGDTELGDLITNRETPAPDETASLNLLRQELKRVLETLPPREARILQLRYGLSNGRSYSLKEIGEKMGVTRERIRQIEAQALRRLRKPSIITKLRGYIEEL